jgi:hypothetical protein
MYKKIFIFLICFIFLISVVFFILLSKFRSMDMIPVRAQTDARMGKLEFLILDYFNSFHKFPTQLSELSKVGPYKEYCKDEWGYPILYSVDANGIVLLKSLGKDGLEGGKNEDEDMELYFKIKNGDISWERYKGYLNQEIDSDISNCPNDQNIMSGNN